MPPEDLPRFYEALVSGRAIHGVRLVYPMERRRQCVSFNLLGNKAFSQCSWLLGQPIGDTLCGTKVRGASISKDRRQPPLLRRLQTPSAIF